MKAVLGILCDNTAQPETLAYDLIIEAEHGPDSSFILVTSSIDIATRTYDKLQEIINSFPDNFRRNNITNVLSKDGLGVIIVTDSIDQSISWIIDYAPEHGLIKVDKSIENYVEQNIDNAGEILLGDYTPFTAGNYCIRITAGLPTNAYAKNMSGNRKI